MKVAYPGEAELFIRIEYVIEFILQHFERINLYAPLWSKLENEGLENKVAHEFALLIFLTSRIENKPDSLTKLLNKALNSLSEFTRTKANFLAIMNDPQKVTRLGQIHIFLTKAGSINAEWDTLIIKMLNKGYGENSERILTRLFDKNWLNHLVFNENIYDTNDIIKYSIINSRCHPVYMRVNEMYAYTHTLMYISDFGKTEIKSDTGNNNIKNIINASLLFQLSQENFDLLGELLMNYTYTENEWNSISSVCWKYFTSTWDNLGFLPGVSFDSKLYTQLDDNVKGAYAFKEVYHTNIVAGILCAGIIESKHRQNKITLDYPTDFKLNKAEINKSIEAGKLFYKINPETISEIDIDTEALFKQIQELIKSNTAPHWFNIISALTSNTCEKNSMLIQLKLMLSIKNQNFKQLIESIDQYMIMDLKINQTFIEAIEFICNRQIESGEFLLPYGCIPSTLIRILLNVKDKFHPE